MIQLFHVYKLYGEVVALEDITLRVDRGEFVYITGPSGAGKTTLLKLLFCAERPTSGQILIGGKNLNRLRASSIPYLRRNIGVVFQDFKLLMNRNVVDNVALALEVLGEGRREIRSKVMRVLRMVGLHHRSNYYPIKLSGGEQQRVAIARAIINDPEILLADEPTGNLDPDLTYEIMSLFREINSKGTTVVVATHNPLIIEAFPARTIALERGRIIKDS